MQADSGQLQAKSRSSPKSGRNGSLNGSLSNFKGVDLSNFSEEERKAILAVVKRDLDIQAMEKHRLRKIRSGLLHEDSQAPLALPGSMNACGICHSHFLFLLNPRLCCDICCREVCRHCTKTFATETLCKICSQDMFYKAMVCKWFYESPSSRGAHSASDMVARSIFKDKIPSIDGLSEEQLYKTVTGYLGPEKGVYVNGKYITPEVVRKIQQDQIKKFIKRYQDIRTDALTGLQRIKSNGVKHNPEVLESEIERVTVQFQQQTRDAIRNLLQMLCITEEKYKMVIDSPNKTNTGAKVLGIAQKHVEHLVGHKIKIPDEFLRSEMDEDLESFVASVTGGPEDFFASVLLEDLKNAMKESQVNGRVPRASGTK